MNTVLLQGRLAVPRAALLRERLDQDWRGVIWHPDENAVAEFPALAAAADVIIGGAIPVNPWPEAPRLKRFRTPWPGHARTSAERLPRG